MSEERYNITTAYSDCNAKGNTYLVIETKQGETFRFRTAFSFISRYNAAWIYLNSHQMYKLQTDFDFGCYRSSTGLAKSAMEEMISLNNKWESVSLEADDRKWAEIITFEIDGIES